MMVTAELLTVIGACQGGVHAFKELYPYGATWDVINMTYFRRDAYTTTADIRWAAYHLPACIEDLTWERRKAVCASAAQLAVLACKCPKLPSGGTWRERVEMTPEEVRYLLAIECPDLGEDDTWAARYDLCRPLGCQVYSLIMRCTITPRKGDIDYVIKCLREDYPNSLIPSKLYSLRDIEV